MAVAFLLNEEQEVLFLQKKQNDTFLAGFLVPIGGHIEKNSKLKKWMVRFNGVETKYLQNCMYWFKWLQYFDTRRKLVQEQNKNHSILNGF